MYMKSRGRRRRPLAVASLAVAALAFSGVYGPLTAGAEESPDGAQTQDSRLQEVWRADFDGDAGSPPSGDDWIIDTGTGYDGGPPNWGTGEVQTYTDRSENLQLDGEGHLKITALKDGDTWTSGRIETRRTDFAAPEGGKLRIEASLRTPEVSGDAALGYWPAFWTLGDEYRGDYQNWPGVGEFDVMENVNGENTTHGVLHCGVNPGGPCNETQGIGGEHECSGSCQSDFHEYAIELDRSGGTEELRWYVDGEQFHSVAASDMDPDTWAKATGHGHFILLNLAMGGAFPDGAAGEKTPTAATEPGASMLVDHVSVESTGGSSK